MRRGRPARGSGRLFLIKWRLLVLQRVVLTHISALLGEGVPPSPLRHSVMCKAIEVRVGKSDHITRESISS